MGKTEKKKLKEAASGHGHRKKKPKKRRDPVLAPKLEALGIDRGYWHDDRHFHSSYELAYYVWLEANGKKFVYRPDMKFDYVADDDTTQEYTPCFLVEGKFYDVKTEQFFDDEGKPFNKYVGESWQRKHDFLVENGVVILREADLKEAFDFVKTTKGKTFLKDARVKTILGQ